MINIGIDQNEAEELFTEDAMITVFGENYKIRIIPDENEVVSMEEGCINLSVRDAGDHSRAARIVYAWYRQLIVDTFRDICHETYPYFIRYKTAYPQIKIKTMRSRWGSCIPSKGIIALNSRLIEHPRRCIEYVVLHEFCHFIVQDHSKNFYALVGEFMPDWKERRKELDRA